MNLIAKHFVWAIACTLVLAAPARAADEEAAEEEVSGGTGDVQYVPLQPSFIINFGDGDGARLQYVKADVAVRVSSSAAASAARYHLPALRNALVLLLSRQDESTVSTGSGREALRAEALAAMRSILEEEEGKPFIEDVLFTNFIVQR